MLHARHQAFLAQQQQLPQKTWNAWLRRQHPEGTRGIKRVKMDDPLTIAGGGLSARKPGDVDIGLCEEGNSNQKFARVVVLVVDITEEGRIIPRYHVLAVDRIISHRFIMGSIEKAEDATCG